ncbi:endo-alpha-N-acetylgalactosaminidase family protein [Streptomyces uncialis]|uniref:endo-alpha-N-acetylgalactosaminidase family protein n=1 Tax=Streptomyces uncialis TaxID=1048205 RepID=UPI00225751AF|nr:endo-alpha-N-acetylgalactosaminidase family protein [Streptomyces uncialis]MCX4659904.1 endo-alpha-N-acetylgalactosaminidase family protein [Streptomyces uncialis]
MSRRFRTACALVAASSAVFALAGPVAAAVPTADAAPSAADPVGGPSLRSGKLTVTVAKDFPRVLAYTDRATGARLLGSTAEITEVTLNGKPQPVRLGSAPDIGRAKAAYTLTFPELPGVEIDTSLSVSGRTVTFRVTAVRDTEAFRVGTIDIPGHDLVSVGSGDGGARTAFTRLDPDSTRTADVFADVTPATPAYAPRGAAYALVNTAGLAAAVESNSTYDKPSGATAGDNARFWHQARKAADGSTRVGVRSGQWTYRGEGSPTPARKDALPWAKVVVTPDANADRTVDWQDAAIAFRGIGIKAPGADDTPDRVITHIPFNFASQATHPFLRTLDDVKRISLATDGLGQLAMLKGYASEGHDSAHPDYGGDINKRAGGLTDLNKLLRDGEKWGATFGVHINATEAYPEAKNFSEKLVDKNKPGWNWLNQSYYIDQRRDVNSGELARRFKELRDETHRNLSQLYVDVYYSHGWIAEKTAEAIRDQGWNLSTEWADKFERQSLWSHWANDLNYGGVTNKGLNSKIIRFIRNSEKDVWNNDPVLGQTILEDFEGWTGENDWDDFYAAVWERDLPAKYLQQEKILRWEGNDIALTGGVRGIVENGTRAYYDNGRKVLDGTTYLLPWADGRQGKHGKHTDRNRKLYHFNKTGGTTTWEVPGSSYTVHKLTDNGRVKAGTVRAKDGRITLTAEAGQPYVLYADGRVPKAADPRWGEGTPVKDPGFNDARLDDWRTTGTVTRDKDDHGRNSAALTGTGKAAVEQRISGLTPGKRYTASAWLEVEPGKDRRTTLTAGGASVSVERSTLRNTVAASDWHSTNMQRAKVTFTAPRDGRTTLRVEAAAGSGAKVRADDIRIVRNDPAAKSGTLVHEDFENVDQGWGPFAKGAAGGVTDPRTHIAQKNAPYTQSGWNGKLVDDVIGGAESLKTHEGDKGGLVYRTTPATAPLKPGNAYRIDFAYQSSHAGSFDWVTGYDQNTGGAAQSVETRATPVPERRTTGTFTENVVAGCGDTWVGLRMRQDAEDGADFVLDDFTVTDLGPATERPACARLALTGASQALEPGAPNKVTATFTSFESTEARDPRITLELPDGWSAEPAGPATPGPVAPGARTTAEWQVTPPAGAAYRPYELKARATYTVDGAPRSLTAATTVRTLPPPPTGDAWASDLDWTDSTNGWGPVERDLSNGETGTGDGSPLRIGGVTYAKGLGTHATSSVRYFLGGKCTALTAQVGVDDVQTSRGTVRFTVLADRAKKAESPVLRATDAAWSLTADVTGARYVDLLVGDGGDGVGNDHADWGDAKFHCAP